MGADPDDFGPTLCQVLKTAVLRDFPQMPLVSIIVPIFNAEPHLDRCVKSLKYQTLKDIEIICINDGSTHASLKIIDDFAKEDKRIKVIDIEQNGGTSEARRVGIRASKGQYIMFVDSDDYLEADACADLCENIESLGVDIIHFEANVTSKIKDVAIDGVRKYIQPYYRLVTGKEVFRECFIRKNYQITLWNKIFKADLCRSAAESMESIYAKIADDTYLYFVIATMAKSYKGIGGKKYYNYTFDSGVSVNREMDLRRFGVLCGRVRPVRAIENFVRRQGLGSYYIEAANNIRNEMVDSCVYIWFHGLSVEESGAGFDVLIENWSADDVLFSIIRQEFHNQDLIAKRVLGARCLEARRDSIATIGVFNIRLRSGGVERVVSELMPIWVRMGYRLVFFADEEASDQDYHVDVPYVRVALPALSGRGSENFKARTEALRKAIVENEVDVFVHNCLPVEGLIFDILAVKLLGVPVVLSNHGHFAVSLSWMSDVSIKNLDIFPLADAVVVLSEAEVEFWRVCGLHAHYVPNPLSINLSEVRPAKLDTKNVIWVGRLAPEKQYLEAVGVIALVAHRIPDVKLLIVGQADSWGIEGEILRYADGLGVKNNIEICGYYKDVSKIYDISSVFLCTSATETFSLTIFEAKAHGLPVVLYDLPGLELLRDGFGFVAVPQRDRRAAANAIIRLLEDDALRAATGLEARRSAETFEANSQVAQRWRRVFECSISNKKKIKDSSDSILMRDNINGIFRHARMGYNLLYNGGAGNVVGVAGADDVADLRRRYDAIVSSSSWKITRPLRVIFGILKGDKAYLQKLRDTLRWR